MKPKTPEELLKMTIVEFTEWILGRGMTDYQKAMMIYLERQGRRPVKSPDRQGSRFRLHSNECMSRRRGGVCNCDGRSR